MKPYKNIKLQHYPDVADCKQEGRPGKFAKQKPGGEYGSYSSPKTKAESRRILKRRDKIKFNKENKNDLLF